jgi:hypothetical protein
MLIFSGTKCKVFVKKVGI